MNIYHKQAAPSLGKRQLVDGLALLLEGVGGSPCKKPPILASERMRKHVGRSGWPRTFISSLNIARIRIFLDNLRKNRRRKNNAWFWKRTRVEKHGESNPRTSWNLRENYSKDVFDFSGAMFWSGSRETERKTHMLGGKPILLTHMGGSARHHPSAICRAWW